MVDRGDQSKPHPKAATPAMTALAVLSFAVVGIFARRSPSGAVASHAPPDRAPAAVAGRTDPKPASAPAGIVALGRSVLDRMGRDNITLVAAGVAFYVMLAIFPALAAMVSLYGLIGDPGDVARRLQDYAGLLPPESMKLILDGLGSFTQKSGSQLSLALITSVLLALWSARAGISSIMSGLNIAYEETEKRSFVMQNLIALALTAGGIVFAVLVVVAVPLVPIALNILHIGGLAALLTSLLRWPILALIVAGGFAVVYRVAPSRTHPRWRWISWGSAIATLGWLIGSALFSVYVSRFGSYDATYGSLGAVVVLLLWFWVSALVLLVGAEIDAELEARYEG